MPTDTAADGFREPVLTEGMSYARFRGDGPKFVTIDEVRFNLNMIVAYGPLGENDAKRLGRAAEAGGTAIKLVGDTSPWAVKATPEEVDALLGHTAD